MSFQGKTIGAERVGARINTAVREKFRVLSGAYRAGDGRSAVKDAEDLESRSTEPLKILSGNIADQPGYDFFHVAQR